MNGCSKKDLCEQQGGKSVPSLTTPASLKHMEKYNQVITTDSKDETECAGRCLKGLIQVDLIIVKEMNSKFGKAIKVIKDVKQWDQILDAFLLNEDNKR